MSRFYKGFMQTTHVKPTSGSAGQQFHGHCASSRCARSEHRVPPACSTHPTPIYAHAAHAHVRLLLTLSVRRTGAVINASEDYVPYQLRNFGASPTPHACQPTPAMLTDFADLSSPSSRTPLASPRALRYRVPCRRVCRTRLCGEAFVSRRRHPPQASTTDAPRLWHRGTGCALRRTARLQEKRARHAARSPAAARRARAAQGLAEQAGGVGGQQRRGRPNQGQRTSALVPGRRCAAARPPSGHLVRL